MYNTDRILGYDSFGTVVFLDIEGSFQTKGKEWSRGYTQEPRYNYFYALGTDLGAKPFDFRTMFRNVWRDICA